jgi:spore maturation protein CgeB
VRFVLFYHSLVSDWNHGNAHFLRGIVGELTSLGHHVRVLEPADGWSLCNLREQQGETALNEFATAFPHLRGCAYELGSLDFEAVLDAADVVIVHEWNDPALVHRVGEYRRGAHFKLLFHDTHHRAVSSPSEMERLDLSQYDGVLAFGAVLSRIYRERGWAARTWTWHEAADTRVFRPIEQVVKTLDLAWIGNWGDGERARELHEFLLDPVRTVASRAQVFGVRYPPEALAAIRESGIEYRGWIANYRVPAVFATAGCTVHIPRRFYRESLPGIPTIRVFEALACAIPLVCAPWDDAESLFTPGEDFLVARDGAGMQRHLRQLQQEPEFAEAIALRGLKTLRSRHTCAHRVQELLSICAQLGADVNGRAGTVPTANARPSADTPFSLTR